MNRLVSILIPAYNAEKFIADTLRSVLGQTWPEREVIVVDDGSRDRTAEVARSFPSAQVKVIVQENRGAAAARNRAYREAQGEFIQYLDADDLMSPGKIELQVKHLQDRPPGLLAVCGWARFYHRPEDALFPPDPPWGEIKPLDWLLETWEANGMMHPGAWLTPRAVADQAGPWDESLNPGVNDDGEYFSRVVLASRGLTYCPGARTYYRSGNPGSLSHPKSEAAWDSLYRSLVLSTGHALRFDGGPRTRRVCADVLQRFVYLAYPQVPHLVRAAQERVAELGGSALRPEGGPLFRLVRGLVGWKRAKRLQDFAFRHGFRRLAVGWRLHRLGQRVARLLRARP